MNKYEGAKNNLNPKITPKEWLQKQLTIYFEEQIRTLLDLPPQTKLHYFYERCSKYNKSQKCTDNHRIVWRSDYTVIQFIHKVKKDPDSAI